MFGLMRPDESALSGSERARHRRYYCGLCHGVGTHVGHGWRAIHSHDAVFVATVVDGLLDEPAAPSSCRCPMLPVVHQDTRDPSSVAMRFAVGIQLLLADQWVADKAEEGSRPARFARDVLAAPVSRGVDLLAALSVDLGAIDRVEVRQRLAETRGGSDPVIEAARPTERALGSAFGAIAGLPGAPMGVGATLVAFGEGIGRAIYLIDALEDLSDDAVGGDFNPCLRDGEPCPRRVEQAVLRLVAALDAVEAGAERLPWRRNGDLVLATLAAVRRRGERAAALAREQASDEGRPVLMRWVAQPKWVHAAAALLTAFMGFWSAFSTAAVAATDQAGTVVRGMAPEWLVPQTQSCPCDQCGKACNDCGDSCQQCGDACQQCGDGCSDCGDACSDCGDACNNCNNCNVLGLLFS